MAAAGSDNQKNSAAAVNCSSNDCDGTIEETYELEEWLHVGNECDVCHKVFCGKCMRVCYTCRNGNEDGDGHDSGDDIGAEYCKSCAMTGNRVLSNAACTVGHVWKQCKNHRTAPCGECTANSNFHGKMG